MFNPSRDQARRFFIEAWRKHREGKLMSPMEAMTANVISMHPEYHAMLEAGDAAIERDWTPEMGESNPFLHLSLHIAIEEQLSIDQPPGIRAAFDRQMARLGERHDALHILLECLAEQIWSSQRHGTPLDSQAYLSAIENTLR